MAVFSIGHEVEIKGFDRWTGATLLGGIVGSVKRAFYIVEIFIVMDDAESDNDVDHQMDDSYYLKQQEQYRVVHPQFVRDTEARKECLKYNIGDVVDWQESYMILKGTIIQKEIIKDHKRIDPANRYTYLIMLDHSTEVVTCNGYEIRHHIPWERISTTHNILHSNSNISSSCNPRTFPKGKDIEIKGFGKWLGVSLLGEVIGHFNQAFYIVQLWCVIDPDYDGEYDNKPKDDDYYYTKQGQYQIIHQRFVREDIKDQSSQEFDIGDVVDWNDLCIMRKGRVVAKSYRGQEHLTDPNEHWIYDILLDGSDENVDAHSCHMRPHRPWP